MLKGNSQFLEERGIIADEVLLKKADYIICHNKSMKKYLLLRGFDNQKLVELEIFDYLHDCKLSLNRKKDNSIIIAGNLLKEKAGYVYKLIEKDIIQYKINLILISFLVFFYLINSYFIPWFSIKCRINENFNHFFYFNSIMTLRTKC